VQRQKWTHIALTLSVKRQPTEAALAAQAALRVAEKAATENNPDSSDEEKEKEKDLGTGAASATASDPQNNANNPHETAQETALVGSLTLYVDGKWAGTIKDPKYKLADFALPLSYLGSPGPGGKGFGFHGVLLDLRLWNQDRSFKQVRADMHRLIKLEVDGGAAHTADMRAVVHAPPEPPKKPVEAIGIGLGSPAAAAANAAAAAAAKGQSGNNGESKEGKGQEGMEMDAAVAAATLGSEEKEGIEEEKKEKEMKEEEEENGEEIPDEKDGESKKGEGRVAESTHAEGGSSGAVEQPDSDTFSDPAAESDLGFGPDRTDTTTSEAQPASSSNPSRPGSRPRTAESHCRRACTTAKVEPLPPHNAGLVLWFPFEDRDARVADVTDQRYPASLQALFDS
jgi:hypothetical protein